MDRRASSLVVVGASAGGVEGLRTIAAGLPADLPAAVGVVLHVSPTARSLLPEILGRAGPLSAGHAEDGEPILAGHIAVAPPDHHLLVDGAAFPQRGGRVWRPRRGRRPLGCARGRSDRGGISRASRERSPTGGDPRPQEEALKERVKLYATDIDEEALAQARDATYTAKQLDGVSAELRDKYFQTGGRP